MQERQEMWVGSLGLEDPLEKEMASHSNILAWKIPWTEEPGRLQSTGLQEVGEDWAMECTHCHVLIPSFHCEPPFCREPACYTGPVCGCKTIAPYAKLFGKRNVPGTMVSWLWNSNQARKPLKWNRHTQLPTQWTLRASLSQKAEKFLDWDLGSGWWTILTLLNIEMLSF